MRHDVFNGGGCLGGRCECGAAFVIDETGREGGQASLDVVAIACDGDLDRALALTKKVDFRRRVRLLGGRSPAGTRRAVASGGMPPKVWFVKLKS